MPNTQGFEIVSEVTVDVLRQLLRAAWKSGDDDSGEGVIPEKIEIPPGLAFGPYQVKEGTVQIPKEELGLEMETSINGVEIKLGTIVQVEIDNPPIPSATLFDLTADVVIKTPVTTLDGDINVGVKLDNLPADAIAVTITSGDPIGPITEAMVEEYIHEKLRHDPLFPKIYDDIPLGFGTVTGTGRLELYDDESNPSKTATVSYPEPNKVKVAIPCFMSFYDIQGTFSGVPVPSPIEILGVIEMIAPFKIENDIVEAKLSEANVELTAITPAPGQGGANYTLTNNVSGGLVETSIVSGFNSIAVTELQKIGDVSEMVPSITTIETFIEEEIRKELATRKQILIWEPAPPDGVDVTIEDVTIKALNEGLAIAMNKSDSANADALSFFVPNDRDFATAISRNKVLEEIDKAVHEEFGDLPTTLDDKVEGKTVKLNDLNISLKNGAINIKGSVTVVDAILGSIDVDADFDADSGLQWIDGPEGGQIIEPFVIGEPDVDLSLLAWILSFLIGFITFGIVGIIIVAVVMTLAENLAESIGSSIIKDDVNDQLTGIGAWPQTLTAIGEVTARFENPIVIDTQGIMFSGNMLITSMHSLTTEDFANANGPYLAVGNQALMFNGGIENATSQLFWDFDDGNSSILRNPSHIYGKSGLYIAKFRIAVEEEGGVTTRNFTKVNIKNVIPQVIMPSDITVKEGEEIPLQISFTDNNWLDTHTATIYWGDNTAPEDLVVTETNNPPQAQGQLFACHAYCDNGQYQVRVIVRDDAGGIGIGEMTITVENVAPVVYLEDKMYTLQGQCVHLEGYFEDQGWCDTHTGEWDLGNCTIRNAFIEETNTSPKAKGTAKVAHAYEHCGTYQTALTITDDDGGMGQDQMLIKVNHLKNNFFEDGFYTVEARDQQLLTIANHWIPFAALVESIPDKPNQGSINLEYQYEIGVVSEGQRSQKIAMQGAIQVGIMQHIEVNKGWDYEFTANFHLAIRSEAVCRIGIDPLGGTDPDASSIIWREAKPKLQWDNITVRTTARAEKITVFLGGLQRSSVKHTIYWDEAHLYQIQPHCVATKCEETCIDFADMRPRIEITTAFQYKNLLFTPIQDKLFTTQLGAPQDQTKLGFAPTGMHIRFPEVVDKVTITITNHAGRLIKLEALYEEEVLAVKDELIYNETKTITWEVTNMNGLKISGGDYEAALVSICLCLSLKGIKNANIKDMNNQHHTTLSSDNVKRRIKLI